MFASAALGEVVDHSLQIGELRGTVRPQIGSMGLALSRRKHLYRRLVGMQYRLLQHFFAKCIDQV